MATPNITTHRVTLPPDAQRSGWPRAWVTGQVPGLMQLDPDSAPTQVVRVLITTVEQPGGGPITVHLRTDPSPDAPAFPIVQGTDGAPGWVQMAVGAPFVLANQDPMNTAEVTVLLQH